MQQHTCDNDRVHGIPDKEMVQKTTLTSAKREYSVETGLKYNCLFDGLGYKSLEHLTNDSKI